MCICYNVLDRENEHPIWTKNGPPLVLATPWGALLFFYAGKAPSRLLVALVVIVQPFDDVMTGYTTHDSDDESNEHLQSGSPPPLSRVSVRTTRTLYHTVRRCSTLFSAGGLHALSTLRHRPRPAGCRPSSWLPDPCCSKLIFLSELIS